MKEILETSRLTLQAVHTCSVGPLHDTFDVEDESIFSLCGWSRHSEKQQTREFMQQAETEWANGSRYRYAVRLSDTDEIVGTTYIDTSTYTKGGVLGLWIDKPYWGRGISGERASKIIQVGFNELGLTHIRVGCLSENTQSRRAIEKYVAEHGGVFYGAPPVTAETYSAYPQPTRPHYEYAIRDCDFHDEGSGIECTIPSVEYEDISFEKGKQ